MPRFFLLVRALIDELNLNSAAGLITHKALPLIAQIDMELRSIEQKIQEQTDAESR